MKINIITYTRTKNYGGFLQSYALYSYLQNEGYEVEFIDYVPERCNIDDPVMFTNNILRNSRLWGRTEITKTVWRLVKFPKIKKSYQPFIDFLRSRADFSKPYYSSDELVNDYPKADLYITGSDQVWNSSFCRDEKVDSPYYYSFLKNERRISYASSFGKDSIPNKNIGEVKSHLAKYDSLSVREDSGVEIIKQMGLISKRVVDPTLLCEKKVFDDLCLDKLNITGYIVLYQVHFDQNTFKLALQVSKTLKKKLVVISIDSDKKRQIKNCIFVNPNINEWISLIKFSSGIITDSFHACIFSILYEKNFIVNTGTRRKMSTRINGLLNILSLDERIFNGYDKEAATKLLTLDINWEKCNSSLKEEQEKSRKWLNDAIKNRCDAI